MHRRIAGQGERCVLLVKGAEFAEIIESTADGLLRILRPDGSEDTGAKDQLIPSWTPVPATKVIKADGTWMYTAPGVKSQRNMCGSQWYTRGGVFV